MFSLSTDLQITFRRKAGGGVSANEQKAPLGGKSTPPNGSRIGQPSQITLVCHPGHQLECFLRVRLAARTEYPSLIERLGNSEDIQRFRNQGFKRV